MSVIRKNGGFEAGQVFEVGEYFRVYDEPDCCSAAHLGFESDACHATMDLNSDLRPPFTKGWSVDIRCTLTIRGFEKVKGAEMAVVRLDRPETPVGMQAPIGTVFLIPIEKIQRWHDKFSLKRQLNELVLKYVPVVVKREVTEMATNEDLTEDDIHKLVFNNKTYPKLSLEVDVHIDSVYDMCHFYSVLAQWDDIEFTYDGVPLPLGKTVEQWQLG